MNLSVEKIHVAHVPQDCEMQVNLRSLRLEDQQMHKIATILDARNDVTKAKITHGEWLHVHYDPKGLRGAKRTQFEDQMIALIKQTILRKAGALV